MSHLAFMSQLSVTEGENVRKTLRVVWMRPKLQRHPAVGRLGLGGQNSKGIQLLADWAWEGTKEKLCAPECKQGGTVSWPTPTS